MAATILKSKSTNTGTLYHFVGTSSDTKPTWAGINSTFDENDTGKSYYYTGHAWVEKAGGSSIGGGSSSGGTQKFVVTLGAEEVNEETVWSANKTLSEIIEADEAGKICVALYPVEEQIYIEVPLLTAISLENNGESFTQVAFSGIFESDGAFVALFAMCVIDGNKDSWQVTDTEYPQNESLIVNMTADEQTQGKFNGDTTFKEIYYAFSDGKHVVIKINNMRFSVQYAETRDSDGNTEYYISFPENISTVGLGSDTFTISFD